jgi:hypothetical protein
MSDIEHEYNIINLISNLWVDSKSSVVGIATGYGLYDRGVGVRSL